METIETPENSMQRPGIALNYEAQIYLKEAGKWAAFLGIVGFVFCALVLLVALSIGTILTMIAKFSPDPNVAVGMAGAGSFLTILYILIDVLYFFFSLYLYQFGSRIKKGLTFSDSIHITSALSKLKSFFKLWGILTIIALCFYALILVGVILFSARMDTMMHR